MSGPAQRVADLVGSLPATLDALQADGLRTLASYGLVGSVDGQPAWPLARRLAIETLAIDAGLARQTLSAAGVTGLLVLAVVTALVLALAPRASGRGRVRAWAQGIATAAAAVLALLLIAAPWPSASLLLRPAVASSFHRAPDDLGAVDLANGLRLYREQCAACHGSDGRGETPQAASLPVWPPRLSGALLWRRAEGETWWQVREGIRSADGTVTMPAFADRLSGRETWAVLGALRLLASGQTLAEQGQWPWPVAAPDFAIDCGVGPRRRLADWRGRRVMIAVAAPESAWPREDPRYETVVLTPPFAAARSPGADMGTNEGTNEGTDNAANAGKANNAARSAGADSRAPATGAALVVAASASCRAVDEAAVAELLATVAAVPGDKLEGLRILVDRDGWLRVRGRPDEGGWRDEDLICRTNVAGGAGSDAAGSVVVASDAGIAGDGLDRLIRRIDADPMPSGRLLVLHGPPTRQGQGPR